MILPLRPLSVETLDPTHIHCDPHHSRNTPLLQPPCYYQHRQSQSALSNCQLQGVWRLIARVRRLCTAHSRASRRRRSPQGVVGRPSSIHLWPEEKEEIWRLRSHCSLENVHSCGHGLSSKRECVRCECIERNGVKPVGGVICTWAARISVQGYEVCGHRIAFNILVMNSKLRNTATGIRQYKKNNSYTMTTKADKNQ